MMFCLGLSETGHLTTLALWPVCYEDLDTISTQHFGPPPGNGLLCFATMGTFQFLINYTFDGVMLLLFNSFKSFQSIELCGECGECLEVCDTLTYHLLTAHDFSIMYNWQ